MNKEFYSFLKTKNGMLTIVITGALLTFITYRGVDIEIKGVKVSIPENKIKKNIDKLVQEY